MADKMTAEPEARLFVGGLGWATTNESFAAYFGTFGKLVEAFVVLHKVTGVPRGFGFVWFQDVAVADSVLRMKHVLDGRELELKKSLAKDPLKHGTGASSGHMTGHQGPPPVMLEKAGHEGMRDSNLSMGALSTQMGMLTLQRDISGTTTLSNEREGAEGGGGGQGGQQGGSAQQEMHGHAMQHMLIDAATGQPLPSPYGLPAGYEMGGPGGMPPMGGPMGGGMPSGGASGPMTGGAHQHHPYGAAAHPHPAFVPPVAYRAVPGTVYAGYAPAPHGYAVAPPPGAYGAYPTVAGPGHMAYAAAPYGRTPHGYALPPPYGAMPPPGYVLAPHPGAAGVVPTSAAPTPYGAGLPPAYTGPVPKAYESLPPGTLASNIPQAMAAKAAAASVAAKAAASGGAVSGQTGEGAGPAGGAGAGSSGSGSRGPSGMPPPYGAYLDPYAAYGYAPPGYAPYGAPHGAAASHGQAGAAHAHAHAAAAPGSHQHGHGHHGPVPTPSPITRTPSGGSGAAQPRHMQADSRKVFVGGLPATITEADFRSYFSRYGTLVDCVVMVDRETGRSRGFGFITYDTETGADLVLAEKHMLHGKIVDCKRAEPKVEHIVAAGSLGSAMALTSTSTSAASAAASAARAASSSASAPAGSGPSSVGPASSPAGAVAPGGAGAVAGVGHGGSTAGLYKHSGMADAVSSWRTSSGNAAAAQNGSTASNAHGESGSVGGAATQQPGGGEQGAAAGAHQEQGQAEGQQHYAFSMASLGINPEEHPYPYHGQRGSEGGYEGGAQQ